MERDCMIAHGASAMVQERLFKVSDPFKISVCKSCGVVVSNLNECQACKSSMIKSCNIPYAAKLLGQELQAILIDMDMRPADE